MTGLERINTESDTDVTAALTRCCGASRWVHAVSAQRPFADPAALHQASEAAWPLLGAEDWREAFSHHPSIGDLTSLQAKSADTRQWAAGEQSGALAAAQEVLQALAAANAAYAAKFGYIFIVCATGKSAAEMLALLQVRLPNDRDTELSIAAEEQKKITRLRLEKMLHV